MVCADPVARGARDRRHDRQLGAGQRVEQRALADVRLAGQHHLQSVAQQRALPCTCQHAVRAARSMRARRPHRVGALQKVDLLVRKIQRRLDQRAQLDERSPSAPISCENAPASERAAERAAASVLASIRSATASACARSSLPLRNARVREFARLREPQPGQTRRSAAGRQLCGGLETARQQQLQQHRATVGLQLEHVLAGVGVRCREVQRQALVDGRAGRVDERQRGGLPRRQRAAADRDHQRLQIAPGDAHDADGAAPGRGGDGDDRIVQARQHAGFSLSRAARPRRRAAQTRKAARHDGAPLGWRGEERRTIRLNRASRVQSRFAPGRPRIDQNGPDCRAISLSVLSAFSADDLSQ